MNNIERLEKAINYAIESSYDIYNRQIEVQRALYSHKTVCIFGTGKFFEDCGIEEYMLRYEYVCDNNQEKWGKEFRGRKCISPNELSQMTDVGVLIMVADWKPIYKQLTALGVDCYPMEWYVLNTYDKHYDAGWFADQREKILRTYDLFEDDISQVIYVEAICNRIAPQYAMKSFEELKSEGEYFASDVFTMTDNEYLVDAGAYKGDSIDEFLSVTNGKCGAIYSFELDKRIFEILKRKVEKYEGVNIALYNKGLSDKRRAVAYNFVRGQEKLDEEVVALDEILFDKKVTMIKMDIETFEIPALNGACNIIKTQHPKLAISAYHYLSDLWNIPRKIKALDDGYKIYLRHHGPVVWDTDCYAVWDK